MLLKDVVDTSERVGATRSRLEKVSALSSLLAQLRPPEISIAVQYLSGVVPQGRIGIGYAAVRRASEVAPAGAPTLALVDVDGTLERIAHLSGPGSTTERQRQLGQLLAKAT